MVAMPVMAAAPGASELEELTCGHGVKLSPPDDVSVEECALAVGDIVGHGSVKSASRMNKMVVVFVGSTDKADQLVAAGVVINEQYVVEGAQQTWAHSVPDEANSSRTKSPLLRHVVSFRRQVVMVLNNTEEELKLAPRFRVDDFDYTVFVTTDSQKCFGCGEEGHLIRSCPKGTEACRPADPHVSAALCAHNGDREAAQNARSDTGTTAEVEEPAGPQGDHPGDHLDLQNERFTGEMVEQTAIRMIETVLDNEDVGVEESSLSVATKRKSTDTKVNNDKEASAHDDDVKVEVHPGYHLEKIKWFLRVTKGQRSVQVEDQFPDLQLFQDHVKMYMKMEGYGEPCFTNRETYRLKKMRSLCLSD
ncbi:Transposon TX1 uncharacterized 82 kDa protein ORF 1 [Takifugu flavidus]|uniref:Transposon TX1 uncharacterized 82 kDa protein ORF 1 n=1 Tax=Takifugu flavidus TaxID=433684 RepID=A0A5C6P125_9TELE|nr:Transposon TX1 uncharacterized 82 kDa protein ORF 1 [Takifugu flavidus]